MNRYALLTIVIVAVALKTWFHNDAPTPSAEQDAAASPSVVDSPVKPANSSGVVSRIAPTPVPVVGTRIRAGVNSARMSSTLTVQLSSAFSLSQLEAAKAKAVAERKPLGFIMVWGEHFGRQTDTRSKGSISALAHFYRAFNNNLVLVYVRHENELGLVPDAVKQGFTGPDEGGWAPNMAVVDATASEFIVEIPYGGSDSVGSIRDQVFSAGAEKIDQWLATHPLAIGKATARP